MTSTICDYSNFDYKKDFWETSNRGYEHGIETAVIKQLLKKHVKKKGRLLDAGCGFGRLYPAYEKHCSHAILVDYAQNLLDQAKESIHAPNITLSKQSLYDLHVSEPVDVIISVRTLHHLNDVRQLFKQFSLALTNNGTLILDIPNKLHAKNRLRHLLQGRLKELFKPSDTKLGEHFYNYHPTRIINELSNQGFMVTDRINVGVFRMKWIKRFMPIQWLIGIELQLTKALKWGLLAPSIYIVAKKHVDNSVDKTENEC